MGEQPSYPPAIAVTNPLVPGAPLKDKGLAKNLFLGLKVEDRTPDQLVKGQSEQPLCQDHLIRFLYLLQSTLYLQLDDLPDNDDNSSEIDNLKTTSMETT